MAIRPYQLREMAILEFILAKRNHPASHEGLGDEANVDLRQTDAAHPMV